MGGGSLFGLILGGWCFSVFLGGVLVGIRLELVFEWVCVGWGWYIGVCGFKVVVGVWFWGFFAARGGGCAGLWGCAGVVGGVCNFLGLGFCIFVGGECGVFGVVSVGGFRGGVFRVVGGWGSFGRLKGFVCWCCGMVRVCWWLFLGGGRLVGN